MNDEEVQKAIGSFEMCKAMMLFDPQTGETHALEDENQDNQDLYHACNLAQVALHQMRTEWIPVSERKPTNADSDESGQVIAFSRFGCCIVHWTTLSTRTPFTHWRPLPAPPESEARV